MFALYLKCFIVFILLSVSILLPRKELAVSGMHNLYFLVLLPLLLNIVFPFSTWQNIHL